MKSLQPPSATIFIVRNSSCGKVMFSHASVILSMGGHVWPGGMHGWEGHVWPGGCVWQGMCVVGVCMVGCMHGRGCMAGGVWQGDMHGRRDGYCSRQYTSYWNAFLFYDLFLQDEEGHGPLGSPLDPLLR